MAHLVVLGSINMDLVVRVPRLPLPGETIAGQQFSTIPGGKGANQAIAAARLGAQVSIIARMGNDAFGQELQANLKTNGVETVGVTVDNEARSGVALISVGAGGENQIIVVPEANGKLNTTDIEKLQEHLPRASYLLMQLEIPLDIVIEAARAASQQNVPVILDPAPACQLPLELYPLLQVITPNATEAAHLVGFPVEDRHGAARAAAILQERGVANVVVTLGDRGVYCATATETFFLDAFTVEAIDTVAAGDAFNGALATALANHQSWHEAIRFASAAGAFSTTKLGAQPSLPYLQEVQNLLRKPPKSEKQEEV